jgi:hypothetical protein
MDEESRFSDRPSQYFLILILLNCARLTNLGHAELRACGETSLHVMNGHVIHALEEADIETKLDLRPDQPDLPG